MLMFESEVGVKVAATRQYAGRGNCGNDVPSGAVKVPASIGSAAVMVVSGSARLSRPVQVSAAAAAPAPLSDAVSAAKATDVNVPLISGSSLRLRIALLCRMLALGFAELR